MQYTGWPYLYDLMLPFVTWCFLNLPVITFRYIVLPLFAIQYLMLLFITCWRYLSLPFAKFCYHTVPYLTFMFTHFTSLCLSLPFFALRNLLFILCYFLLHDGTLRYFRYLALAFVQLCYLMFCFCYLMFLCVTSHYLFLPYFTFCYLVLTSVTLPKKDCCTKK